jgi:hypothetical protein
MTPPPTYGREAVTEKRPAIETWHTPHEVSTSALQGIRYPMYTLEEWDGTPQDACRTAQRILSALSEE